MPPSIHGLHHVSAIAGDPQRNVDFYTGVLGLRLVKQTVNFDDPRHYHLYYGDESGSPGSLLTFFPHPDARRGRQGTGQVAVTSFSVLPAALGFWVERLIRFGLRFDGPSKRGEERVVAFRDHDGLMIELVAHASAESRAGWRGADGIPAEYALRGLHAVTLWEEKGEETGRVLVDVLGMREVSESAASRRYAAGDRGPGTLVDVREVGGFLRGVGGAGTVHHVAFRVADDAAELALRSRVEAAGLVPTPVRDRFYFDSVYFREPGHVLFELATEGPGFTIDEPLPELGRSLRLPPQYEGMRGEIESGLPALRVPEERGVGA
jgi:catechol 2,3-dioxygenase-like lactoylglutathione lyase family enzyme